MALWMKEPPISCLRRMLTSTLGLDLVTEENYIVQCLDPPISR